MSKFKNVGTELDIKSKKLLRLGDKTKRKGNMYLTKGAFGKITNIPEGYTFSFPKKRSI